MEKISLLVQVVRELLAADNFVHSEQAFIAKWGITFEQTVCSVERWINPVVVKQEIVRDFMTYRCPECEYSLTFWLQEGDRRGGWNFVPCRPSYKFCPNCGKPIVG